MSDWKLVKGTPDKPFFEQNPELRYFSVVKRLIEKFGEEDAGKIMWGVWMSEDIEGSFYGMRTEKKRKEINNFLEDVEDFDWEDATVEAVIREYPDMAMPPKKRNYVRLLNAFSAKLRELEEGGDPTLAMKRVQEMIIVAEKEWLDEEEMVSNTGSKASNPVFG